MAKEFIEPKEKAIKCKVCKQKYAASDIVWSGLCRFCAEHFWNRRNA